MPTENLPPVVSREEWLAARTELLVREKELVRLRDRVNAERRRMPMVRIDKRYTLTGPDGPVGLLDVFGGRRQLLVHHFMWTFDVDADGRVAPVRVHFRTEAELAEVGRPWGEGWRVRGDYPAISAFLRVGDDVFHTYSTYGRGLEEFHYGIPYLDLTALGRQEP
jgi:predicted dithiol-disulfide oxidoreductase (DUF899 family)